MIRTLYITAIAALQVMLAWKVVPLVALALQQHIRLGTLPDGWPSIVQVATAAICVVGTGLALGYPSIALMRHAQRGAQRFAGVPAWTVALTFTGAALLGVDAALQSAAHLPDAGEPVRLLAAALPLAPTAVALMSSGVLLGEILRRNRPLRVRSVGALAPLLPAVPANPRPWRNAA